MSRLRDEVYESVPEHQEVYDRLYEEYVRLHDYFGRGENDVMKRLKTMRNETRRDGSGNSHSTVVPGAAPAAGGVG